MNRQNICAFGCLLLGLLVGCAETTVVNDVPTRVTWPDTSVDLAVETDLAVADVGPMLEVTVDAPLMEETVPDLEPTCQPGEGCFMEPCATGADCASGWCVDHQGESVCTQYCAGECPNGWSCLEESPTIPDTGSICISATANLCRPCHDSKDCWALSEGSECLTYGPLGRFCGSSCATTGDCPAGYLCKSMHLEDGSTANQCIDQDYVCECNDRWVELALTTPCLNQNDDGSCDGERACSEFGLLPCDANPPQPESCNGLDDNCDGQVDEGPLCDDLNPCTSDSCLPAQGCVSQPLDSGDCTDGDPCTMAEHCQEGICVAGGAVNCDDGDPCTDDSCLPGEGCQNVPNTAPCSDGNPCTAGDLCNMGECTAGLEADCNDDNSCTKDSCNVEIGCVNQALSGIPCDDGKPCTDDQCINGGCVGTPLEDCCQVDIDCDDGDPCTVEACFGVECVSQAVPGCCHNHAECNDGDQCTQDLCLDNTCQHNPVLNCCTSKGDCDDQNPCTLDDCVAKECVHANVPDCCTLDIDCDDSNVCTTDQCIGGDCLYADVSGCCNVDGECDDGNDCTSDGCDLDTHKCIVAGEGCCELDIECNDDDPCTVDQCLNNVCSSLEVGTCVTLTPNQDAWLEGNGNHGGDTFCIVGKTSSYQKKRCLLQFDLGSIPQGATVLSATFSVYHHYSSKPGGLNEKGIDREVRVHRILAPWNEQQVTSVKKTSQQNWNVPYLGLNDIDATVEALDSEMWIFDELGWKSFNVTLAAKHWLDQPAANFGLLMWATNEDVSGHDRRFHSRESGETALRPQLKIVYE